MLKKLRDRRHGVTIKVRTFYSRVHTEREIGHACNGRAYEKTTGGAPLIVGAYYMRRSGETEKPGEISGGKEKARTRGRERRRVRVGGGRGQRGPEGGPG